MPADATGRGEAQRHDRDVRPMLRAALAERYPGAMVVDELGLEYGTVRVDLAVVNGCIHGYEIKAEADTLGRLRQQAKVYSRALDRCTLVAAARHLDAAIPLVPEWWGVWALRGGAFWEVRPSAENPALDLRSMGMLLWRDEMAALAVRLHVKAQARATKDTLLRALVAAVPPDDLRAAVRDTLRARHETWRLRLRAARSGEGD